MRDEKKILSLLRYPFHLILIASGPTAITPLVENYQLQPTDHFEFRIFKGLFPVFRESGNRPLDIRK